MRKYLINHGQICVLLQTALNSCRWTAQRTRCLMSVSVDVPGHGNFDIALTSSSTAADMIFLLRERLPDSPWHGNKVLSSGVCQLQCDDIVEATHHTTLVLANYSEITNQETHLPLCSFFWQKGDITPIGSNRIKRKCI